MSRGRNSTSRACSSSLANHSSAKARTEAAVSAPPVEDSPLAVMMRSRSPWPSLCRCRPPYTSCKPLSRVCAASLRPVDSVATAHHDQTDDEDDHDDRIEAEVDLPLPRRTVLGGTEAGLGANGQNVPNRGDDPDDEERLELQVLFLEVGHDRAEDLQHDDHEQRPVDDRGHPLGELDVVVEQLGAGVPEHDARHAQQHGGDPVVHDVLDEVHDADGEVDVLAVTEVDPPVPPHMLVGRFYPLTHGRQSAIPVRGPRLLPCPYFAGGATESSG